jgi:PIN domain nuclease of toxin-antitoxin system
MRLLLDTHIALWVLLDDERLPPTARDILRDPSTSAWYSLATLWEVSIKHGLGRFTMSPADMSTGLRDSGFRRLGIEDSHFSRLAELPQIHRDPFDRMLIAQAEVEPLRLLTSDRLLAQYSSSVILV